MNATVLPTIKLDFALAKIMVRGIPDCPGSAAAIFRELAQADLFADTIIENTDRSSVSTLILTLPEAKRLRAYDLIQRALSRIGEGHILMHGPIAKLTVSGLEPGGQGQTALQLFDALAAAGINIDLISTSEALTTVVVSVERANEALDVAQRAFAVARDGGNQSR